MAATTTSMSRPSRDPPPIRLMIVDDSPIARAVLSRMLSAHKDFDVVALAGGVGEALDALRTVPVDIVLLDVEMPGTNGLEALPDILPLGQCARVLIVSSLCEDGAEATVRALALGAADALPKPGTGNFGGRFSEVLAERLRRIGPALREPAAGRPAATGEGDLSLRAMPLARVGCLAMGASTGGLRPLAEFLEKLPPRIHAPILITQHLPVVFMPFFARQIASASGRIARVAEAGMALAPDEILIAPGDAHLGLERTGAGVSVRLGQTRVSSGCMPSVDPMLCSLGVIYGRSALAVIFSGMGRDGLVGSAEMVERGGAVMVQDRASSAVWGMPRAVAEAGLACAALPPADLARRVAERVAAGQRSDTWK